MQYQKIDSMQVCKIIESCITETLTSLCTRAHRELHEAAPNGSPIVLGAVFDVIMKATIEALIAFSNDYRALPVEEFEGKVNFSDILHPEDFVSFQRHISSMAMTKAPGEEVVQGVTDALSKVIDELSKKFKDNGNPQ